KPIWFIIYEKKKEGSMPIKDKEKAREYKRLWAAKKRKQNVEPSPFVEPILKVEPPQNNFVEPVEPQHVEPVEPAKSVEPEHVEPTKKKIEPCSRCPEIENNISEFANLYYQEQEKTQEQKRINQQLEKRIKELEKKPANNSQPQQYLLNLLTKHKQFALTQRLYTPQETQEREFLDKVAKELIGGLLGESQYSELKGGKHE
ncbi:10937_t:CDS:1, partial [Funneliformis geosporum]